MRKAASLSVSVWWNISTTGQAGNNRNVDLIFSGLREESNPLAIGFYDDLLL